MSTRIFARYPQRPESTPTASHSEDTISSMYSDEEDYENEIVASSDEDEQESPEDYCKGIYFLLYLFYCPIESNKAFGVI